jgi:hypothetical protein
MKKVDKKTAFGGGLLVAGATQLSRNQKIRNAGGLALYAVVMGAIGEGIRLILKWIIWEPIKAICKIFWAFTVFICKTSWRLTVIAYMLIKKGFMKLYKYRNTKIESKETI